MDLSDYENIKSSPNKIISIILLSTAFCLALIQQPKFAIVLLVLSLLVIIRLKFSLPRNPLWLLLPPTALIAMATNSFSLLDTLNSLANFLAIIVSVYFAWQIKIQQDSVKDVITIVFSIFLFVIISWVFLTMATGGDYNNITPSGSRNVVTAFVLFAAIPLFYFNRKEHLKLFIISMFTIVLFSEIGGRSSMASAILVAAILFLRNRMVILLFGLAALLYVLTSLDTNEHFVTPRYNIWESYIDCLNFKTILVGVPQLCLEGTKAEYFSFNLHNSFLTLHQHIGIGALFFAALYFMAMLASLRLNCPTSIAIMVVYGIKLNFDTLAFPGIFDFIIFFIWFDILSRYKIEKIKRKQSGQDA